MAARLATPASGRVLRDARPSLHPPPSPARVCLGIGASPFGQPRWAARLVHDYRARAGLSMSVLEKSRPFAHRPAPRSSGRAHAGSSRTSGSRRSAVFPGVARLVFDLQSRSHSGGRPVIPRIYWENRDPEQVTSGQKTAGSARNGWQYGWQSHLTVLRSVPRNLPHRPATAWSTPATAARRPSRRSDREPQLGVLPRRRRGAEARGPSAILARTVVLCNSVSTDAKPIIGIIVGTGLFVAGLVSAQISGVNTRIDDLRTEP